MSFDRSKNILGLSIDIGKGKRLLFGNALSQLHFKTNVFALEWCPLLPYTRKNFLLY